MRSFAGLKTKMIEEIKLATDIAGATANSKSGLLACAAHAAIPIPAIWAINAIILIRENSVRAEMIQSGDKAAVMGISNSGQYWVTVSVPVSTAIQRMAPREIIARKTTQAKTHLQFPACCNRIKSGPVPACAAVTPSPTMASIAK